MSVSVQLMFNKYKKLLRMFQMLMGKQNHQIFQLYQFKKTSVVKLYICGSFCKALFSFSTRCERITESFPNESNWLDDFTSSFFGLD